MSLIERCSGCAEVLGSAIEIDGVPVGNCRDQQIEARCPVFLVCDRAVGEPALAVGVDRGGKGVTRFTFVEAGLAGPAQVGLFKPVEREQRAFNAAEFGQREIQPVLALVGGELAQDRGGRDGSLFDGRNDPDDVIPIGFDCDNLDRAAIEPSFRSVMSRNRGAKRIPRR